MSLEAVIRIIIACAGFRPARGGDRVSRCGRAPAYLFISLATLGVSSRVSVASGAPPQSSSLDSTHLLDTWETREGLPENSVTALAQSADGYLWLGTFNGLARFNGVEFTVFNPGNTPGLPSAGIVNLHLDAAGRLWVSTYEGLVVSETLPTPRFERVAGWSGDYVRTFAERPNGDLLLTSFNGKLFEFANGKLTELPPPPGAPGEGYLGSVDDTGNWWAVQHGFVGRLENGGWVPFLANPGVANDAVGCAPARGGGLWLLVGRELRRVRQGREVTRQTLPEAPGGVWSLAEDHEGYVWIASFNQGFSRVSADGVMTRFNATHGLSDHGRASFTDQENNLWLGTSGDGLLRLAPRRVEHFGPAEAAKASRCGR